MTQPALVSSSSLPAALREYFGDRASLEHRLAQVDGTYRTRSIDSTLALLAPRVRDLGVTRVIDLTPLDRVGLPVFNFCLPNRITECYTAGKGLTREACLVSGLMEAFELGCAMASHPMHEVRALTRAELRPRGEVLDPAELLLPVEGEFDGRERMDWYRCLELGTGRQAFLPADLFGFGYGRGPGVTASTPYRSTNGVASGNSVYEAIVHALCELVERDGLVLSNFGPSRPVAVPRAELPPSLGALLDRLRDAELELLVFDIGTDVGLFAYQAYLVDACGFDRYHLHSGMGCHFDPHVALGRAVTEACQVRLTYFAGARNDVADGPAGADAQRDLLACYGEAEPRPLPPAPPVRLDLAEALDDLLERLAAVGCPEVWVADLSRPDFPQTAVACYVPGLEGPYYDAHGRLAIGERGWEHRQRLGARRFAF